jgi:hypothetical protein
MLWLCVQVPLKFVSLQQHSSKKTCRDMISLVSAGSHGCCVRWLSLQVPLKLVDDEVRQLLLEFPDHTQQLQRLDDVTARARK